MPPEGDEICMIIFDLSMAAIMFLFGVYFSRSNGKAAKLLTGYNTRSDEERKNFDEAAMCRGYGKRMMIMALPFLAGAVIDFFANGSGCVMAWIGWVVLFLLLLAERAKREKRR